MKNKTPLILFIIIMVVGAWLLYSNKSTPQMTKDSDVSLKEESMQKEDVVNEKVESTMEKDSEAASLEKYITYSNQSYNQAQDKKRVLFFHASWCPTCKTADNEFTKNLSSIPEDVVVLKTDYDTETKLKEKYAITYQHTFVQVDEKGDEITRWSGGDIDELISNIK